MSNKDVFISYKSSDRESAFWVRDVLELNGITCWIAPDCIPGGSRYAVEIPKAIQNCKVFVVIVSEKTSFSNWVPKEIDQAINSGKVIMPFMLENCDLKDDFNFYLSNIQRYEAYEDKSNTIKRMILEIRQILHLSKLSFNEISISAEQSSETELLPQPITELSQAQESKPEKTELEQQGKALKDQFKVESNKEQKKANIVSPEKDTKKPIKKIAQTDSEQREEISKNTLPPTYLTPQETSEEVKKNIGSKQKSTFVLKRILPVAGALLAVIVLAVIIVLNSTGMNKVLQYVEKQDYSQAQSVLERMPENEQTDAVKALVNLFRYYESLQNLCKPRYMKSSLSLEEYQAIVQAKQRYLEAYESFNGTSLPSQFSGKYSQLKAITETALDIDYSTLKKNFNVAQQAWLFERNWWAKEGFKFTLKEMRSIAKKGDNACAALKAKMKLIFVSSAPSYISEFITECEAQNTSVNDWADETKSKYGYSETLVLHAGEHNAKWTSTDDFVGFYNTDSSDATLKNASCCIQLVQAFVLADV